MQHKFLIQRLNTNRKQILAINYVYIGSVQFSCSVISDSLQPHESQHARPPFPSLTPGVYSSKLMAIKAVMPSSHLILCHPLLHLPPSPPEHQGLFQQVNSSHEVAKVLEVQL